MCGHLSVGIVKVPVFPPGDIVKAAVMVFM